MRRPSISVVYGAQRAHRLEPSDAGHDQRFEPGSIYSLAVSLHDDHVSGYRHHVSFLVRLGLEADIVARRVE